MKKDKNTGKLLERLSIRSRNLDYKFKLAFLLVSVIPLLTVGYALFGPGFGSARHAGLLSQSAAIVGFLMFIAASGYVVLRDLLRPVIELARTLSQNKDGSVPVQLPEQRPDEIGTIHSFFNSTTVRIKTQMDQIERCRNEITQASEELEKRLRAIDFLFETASAVNDNESDTDVLNMVLEKASKTITMNSGCVLRVDASTGKLLPPVATEPELEFADIDSSEIELLCETMKEPAFYGDLNNHSVPPLVKKIGKYMNLASAAVVNLRVNGCQNGVILIGTSEHHDYNRIELEILALYAFNASIPIANIVKYNKVEEKSRKDDLTGLYNKAHIRSALEDLFSNPDGKQGLSVIMLDIDHFKAYNDRFGHVAGDRHLRRVAELLRKNVRGTDVVGRYGGEEFIIMLPGANEKQATMVAERIRASVEKEFLAEDGPITISAGVYSVEGAAGFESIVQEADRALYSAKSDGRNRVVVRGLTPFTERSS